MKNMIIGVCPTIVHMPSSRLAPTLLIEKIFLVSNSTAHVTIFFFNPPATTEIYTLSLHDALPISAACGQDDVCDRARIAPEPHQRQRREPPEQRGATTSAGGRVPRSTTAAGGSTGRCASHRRRGARPANGRTRAGVGSPSA